MRRHSRHSGEIFDHHSVVEDLHFEKGVLTVHFAGPTIGEREARIIAAELDEAIDSLGRSIDVVLLDLRDVQTMSSLMVGVLSDLRASMRKVRARAVLWGVAPQLESLLHAVGLDRRFRIAHSEADVAALRAA